MSTVAPWPVPVRQSSGLTLVRPLLGVSRREVEAYVAALGIPTVTDPTNASLEYARNRVRRRVLPELRAVNSKAVEHLAQFAERQREDDEALRAVALAWFEAHAVVAPGEVTIDRRALRAAAPAVARRAVREAAERLGIALEGAHLQSILRSASRSGARVDLPLARSETDGRILRLRLRPSPTGTD
jgi:tRNA(Ile)-lysidine synthase